MALRQLFKKMRTQAVAKAKRACSWPRFVPSMERLEDRVVPATVNLGPLTFVGEDLQMTDSHTWEATRGSVLLGLKPLGLESFTPLVQIQVELGLSGMLILDTQDTTQFKIQDANILSVVQGGSPAELWAPPNSKDEFAFKINDLLSSNGMALDDTNSAPLTVKGLTFKATSLGLVRPTTGPSAYYSFDTVTGANVKDTSGNLTEHDGLLLNGAQVGTAATFNIAARPHSAANNQVLALDGTNQFMNVVTSADLQPGTKAFSVSSWILVDPNDNKEQIIAGAQDQNVMDGWEFGITAGTDHKLFVHLGEKNDPAHTLLVTGSVNLPGWHHVAFTYNGSNTSNTVTLFVDGVRDMHATVAGGLSLAPDISPRTPVTFNAGNPGSATATPSAFHGYLDDLVVWNGYLTPDQVNLLADGDLTPTSAIATVLGGERVQLQGTVNFGGVHDFLKFFTVGVTGLNYVIYDKSGISLTGIDGTFTLPNKEFGSFILGGSITVGYMLSTNTYVFGGNVNFSSKPEGPDKKPAFDQVGASFNMRITDLKILELGLGLSGGFNVKGLSVETIAGNPPRFLYNFAPGKDEWEIWGGLSVSFRKNFTLSAFFGDKDHLDVPGIIIKDGKLEKLEATVSGDFNIFGAELSSLGVTIDYEPESAKYLMFGGPVTLHVPIKGVPEDISVDFGTKDAPGLDFENGVLTSLNIGITGDFNIGPIGIHPQAATVQWHVDPKTKMDVFIISGGVLFDLVKFKAGVTLGTPSQPGLLIMDGKFYLNNIDVLLADVQLGIFELKKLDVHYSQPTPDDKIDISINLDVVFPGGWAVGGFIDIVGGQLDAVDVMYDAGTSEGIAIADTGLFLTHIEATVKNIEHPSNIVVTGSLDVVFGTKVSFGQQSVAIFRAHGDITVDKNELILDGDAELGAYRKTDGDWTNVLGGGTMRIDLDWATGVYQAHLDVDGLGGFFTFNADFTFAVGKDIRILAEGFVTIPTAVPFIGGSKIGGVGIFFDHVFPHDNVASSTTLAAWLELDIFKKFDIGFELLWDANHTASFSLIGTGTVNQFKSPPPTQQNKTFIYKKTFDKSSLPSSATAMTLGVDWSKADPNVKIVGTPVIMIQRASDKKIFTEAEFTEANNLELITDPKLVKLNTKTVHIAGNAQNPYTPINDQYTLITEITTDGSNPFPNQDDLAFTGTYHIPKPTMDVLNVPANPKTTIPLTLSGRIDPAFVNQSHVSVFVTDVPSNPSDPSPPGRLVGTSNITLQSDKTTWKVNVNVPIDGLFPTNYYLYAILDQQPLSTGNVGNYQPTVVRSTNTAVFEPQFAIHGSVANQNSHALLGWTVFLDLNRNGVHDQGEPEKQTNDQGFYSFAASAVPLNHPFDIRLIPLADDFVLPNNPKSNVTYNGQDPIAADFQANEKSAIRGTVKAGDQCIANAVVYLDANHNGKIDPGEESTQTSSGGEYAFTNLQPGTYPVTLKLSGDPVTAYSVPTVAGSYHATPSALGMAFNVTNPVEITSLGIFDAGGDGFHGTLNAILYDRVTQKAVATVQFTQADPGTLSGGSRFKALSQPVTLYTGFQGLIVAEGFTNLDMWGDNDPKTGPTNAGANQLVFVGTGVSGPFGQYPTNVGGNKDPNPYMAGTFVFSTPTRVLTSPAGGTYTVTIDNSGFDLKDGNDFGVQPFSSISGTITGQQRNEGQLGPIGPQGGVTVNLELNGLVVGNTTTAANGGYTFSDLQPGNYTVEQQVPDGYKQTTPLPPLQLQSPNPSGNQVKIPNDQVNPTQSGIAVADFDGNGQLDIAVLGTYWFDNPRPPVSTPDVYIVYNGDFQHPVALHSGGGLGEGRAIVAGNFGEGLPGLMILESDGRVALMRHLGNRLVDGQVWTTIPKINGSGFADLVTGTFFKGQGGNNTQLAGLAISENNYSVTTFGQGITPVIGLSGSGGPFKMAAGDVNGDGLTDLFIPTQGIPVLYYGNGKGGFTSIPVPALAGATATVIGDINGDGLPDLGGVIGNQGSFKYSLQTTSSSFSPAISSGINTTSASGGFVFKLILADVNGDFRPDLIWCSGEHMFVATNTGVANSWISSSQMTSVQLSNDDYNNFYPAVGDLNGDGLNDLAATGGNGEDNNTISLVENKSALAIPITVQVSFGQNPNEINFNNAQARKGVHHTLSMPPKVGAGDWTVSINGNRLEVRDRLGGLVSSKLLDDLNSLTIVGDSTRANQITFDLSQSSINLPGGIHFTGSTKQKDTVRFILGDHDDVVNIGNGSATLNDLNFSWSQLDSLIIKTGTGNDSLKASGPLSLGALTLSGGAGDDTYVLAAQNSIINIIDSSGTDTLDFSQAQRGVVVDLSRDRGENQLIGSGMQLRLNGVIENLIGTAFDDVLKGNAANNLILGGVGNDKLWGGAGRDVLIGGLGRDVIQGSWDDDILIGGTTAFDNDRLTLQAVMAEWALGHDYITRVKNLTDGSGSSTRRNGNTFLNSSTILDDHAVDMLFGGPGRDWFLAMPGDRTPDRNSLFERIN